MLGKAVNSLRNEIWEAPVAAMIRALPCLAIVSRNTVAASATAAWPSSELLRNVFVRIGCFLYFAFDCFLSIPCVGSVDFRSLVGVNVGKLNRLSEKRRAPGT